MSADCPTLKELPAYAHFEVACPFCQMQGTLTTLSTRHAERLTWPTPTKARFIGIECPTCRRKVTIGASRCTP